MERKEALLMKNSTFSVEWIINFTYANGSDKQKFPEGKPSISLIYSETETVIQERAEVDNQKKTYKALEFLNLIQDACRELKGECLETLERKTTEPYEEKLVNITEDIKYLFGVIQEFTELMQTITPPPEDPPKEDPPSKGE
jgi:hypothetical protein